MIRSCSLVNRNNDTGKITIKIYVELLQECIDQKILGILLL